jgi:hypothetical protein
MYICIYMYMGCELIPHASVKRMLTYADVLHTPFKLFEWFFLRWMALRMLYALLIMPFSYMSCS